MNYNIKNYKTFSLALLFFFVLNLNSQTIAKDTFFPWKKDVKVADELCQNSIKKNNKIVIKNAATGAGIFLIKIFQHVISPQDGPACRFYPTCSHYGLEAVEIHGIFLGSFLAGGRILRCNPFTLPGKDPVPKKIFK